MMNHIFNILFNAIIISGLIAFLLMIWGSIIAIIDVIFDR